MCVQVCIIFIITVFVTVLKETLHVLRVGTAALVYV